MRIGIDARPLRHPYTGIGTYLEQILKVFVEQDPQNEYFLYSHQDFEMRFKTNHKWQKRIGWGGVGTVWLHTQLPFLLIRDNLDVFWGPQYAIPFWPSRLSKVITIHDLVFYHYPETLPTLISLHNKYGLKHYLKKALKVIVDSYSTKQDVQNVYNISENKLQVIHLAPKFISKSDKNSKIQIDRKFGLSPGYILCVGTIEPRKNIVRLLEAYSMTKIKYGITAPLVIAGGWGWKYQGILDRVKELDLEKNVVFTGYLTENELDQIYWNASIFVYPSLYEGFGLPPLEAMAHGLPVITSNTSSLPEVVGNAGITINPFNVEELAESIWLFLKDNDLRNDYVNKSIKRVEEFTWVNTAVKTLKVLHDAGVAKDKKC